MTIVLISLLIATLLSGMSILYSTLVYSISPMPTSRPVKWVILDLLNKHKSANRIYELGSGWGTLVYAISKEFPTYKVIGFERSPIPYLYSMAVNKMFGRKNCQLKYNDFFRISLADTDIVVCYLCTSLMSRLKQKLENELKRGSLVISSTFAVPGWQPVETITANDLYRSKVYVYRTGGTD